METAASFGSSRQGCESSEMKVLVPPIACCRADSMSDACQGNDVRSARMSKLVEDGAYVHQHLNLGTKGKAHGRNAKASNRT